MATNNVSVAVRIRPKLQKEVIDMCNICTRVTPGEPQIWLGHDKAFTFDHVFDCDAKQGEIYENCVENLVDGCFDGYNATVLAYGQTGSGKTYSMGTGFDVSCPDDQLGIIPRAVRHLFAGINRRKEEARQNDLPLPEFSVTAQFIEIYNEELIDLLCEKSKKGGGGANGIRIQEDLKRGIILTGVENKAVSSAEETLACLKNGSLFRTTGATLMNSESSRSHAIFTLFIKQSRVERVEVPENNGAENGGAEQELITLTAKFNFVDLAGSERLARTGAVGERAREGISINSGLLHLGNVISALGDRSKKASHIPYRDSKLTRVLQDSLGGNSVTTMIACISPCDRDFVETLNTLRYANRAKNIKNKVVANQDSQTQLITELRKQVMLLEQENKELRQGKLLLTGDGELELNDVHLENEMLQRDLNNANIRIKALSTRLSEVSEENVTLQEQIAMNQIRSSAANGDGNEDSCAEHLIKGYLKEINELRSKVMESETTINYYQRQLDLQRNDVLLEENGGDIISKCRQEIELSKFKLAQQQQLNSPTRTTPTTGGALTADNENAAAADDDMEEDEDGDESGENEYIEEEFEKNIAGQNAELATLMEMIASKEKLIEEAEARQRRIIQLTEHYEQKITSFKTKIKQTEDERDSLMSKLKTTKDDLNLKKVKEDYEKRLNRLQQDVRKFEALKREHQKVVREEHNSKEMLKKMRQEIVEAKHQRVRMISQMKEQMSKHNREIQKNRLVINKLTREDQKKDFKIRDLEQRSNRQKMMLQRREDEIKALRRQVKPAMSDKAAGRIARRLSRGASGHTPQKARNKWANFEQKFNQLINQRIAFEQEEKKLERYLQDRQTNLTLLSTLKENEDDSNNEYIESVQTNIDYLTKCIEDCQTAIMQLEDDNFSTDQHFSLLDTEEAMYIMNKLVNTAVNYAITASQKEEELKEKDARLNSLWNDNAYSNHLLNYMVAKTNFDEENELFPFNIPANPFSNEGLNGSGGGGPNSAVPTTPVNNETKFRRLTRTPNELLYDMSRPQQQQQRPLQPLDLNATYVANAINNLSDLKEEEDGGLDALSRATAATMNGTFVKDSTNSSTASSSSKENSLLNNTFIIDHQQQQLGTAKPEQLGNSRANATFVLDQKQQLSPENSPSRTILRTARPDQQQPPSPVAVDRFISDRMTQSLHIDNNAAAAGAANGGESGTGGFGGSRSGAATTVIRKASFNGAADLNRVPSAPSLNKLPTSKSSLIEYSAGKILPYVPVKADKSFPLQCTHTIVGHRRPVLTVTATSEVLFSGSKDGTAKIWDLNKCEEVYSLNDHPDAVNVVRYDEYNKLIYTVSKSIIKIWDPREHPVCCVNTLHSAGFVGAENISSTDSNPINDIRLSADGSTLFSTSEKLVRVWDLRTFACVGKLNTGHKSLVTCLAVDDEESNENRTIITGSKDHYIKVFELERAISGIHIPKYTLKPPHYDGIETLRLADRGRTLFSGARDGCIKKWDLTDQRMLASLSNCHRDWVLALDTFMAGQYLLSACRGGYLRMWRTEDCRPLGEIQAHQAAIHSMATISQAVFTASSDCSISLWQYREPQANAAAAASSAAASSAFDEDN